MVKAHVLIETEVGKSRQVAQKLVDASNNGHAGKISNVDTVTGPYDVIATIMDIDVDRISELVTKMIQTIPGVQRTTTCLATHLS